MKNKSSNLIQSVQRSIDIINCFDEKNPSLTLHTISQMLDLNINTTRGLINTLVANGLVTHDSGSNTYSLGLYFVLKSNLVFSTGSLGSLVALVHPELEVLSRRLDVFCSFQLIDQFKIFMVDSVNPENAHYKIMASQYDPLPLYCTSSGKLFLQQLKEPYRTLTIDSIEYTSHTSKTIASAEELRAVLKEQEQRSYALECEELALGIGSIAVPVTKEDGSFLGSISITAFTQVLEKQKDVYAKALSETAREIERLIASYSAQDFPVL